MSAEVLHRAAAKMRETAEAAILASGDDRWDRGDISWNDARGTVWVVNAGDVHVADANVEEQAEHIASWHPAVALAVADVLDKHAARIEETGFVGHLHAELIVLAHTYLGGQS